MNTEKIMPLSHISHNHKSKEWIVRFHNDEVSNVSLHFKTDLSLYMHKGKLRNFNIWNKSILRFLPKVVVVANEHYLCDSIIAAEQTNQRYYFHLKENTFEFFFQSKETALLFKMKM